LNTYFAVLTTSRGF